MSITYDSAAQIPYSSAAGAVNGIVPFALRPLQVVAPNWTSNLHKSLIPRWDISVQVFRGSGRWVSFTRVGSSSNYISDPDVSDSLVKTSSGWRYRDVNAGTIEDYDASGRITRAAFLHGGRLEFEYSTEVTPVAQASSAGLLIKVTDECPRRSNFDPPCRLNFDPGLVAGIA